MVATAGRVAALDLIAAQRLGLCNLAQKGSDREDFCEVAVWQVKAALEAAYEAGRGADLLITIDGGAAITWPEFVSANVGNLGPDDLAAIRADLDRHGAHHGGGGSAGDFTIKKVVSNTSDRAPACATARAASIAGILAAAVMANEMSLFDRVLPDAVHNKLVATLDGDAQYDMLQYATDFREGVRVAHLMISARARASVRTPSQAALSGAEAALALAEDTLDPNVAWNDGEETPDLFAVLEAVRDTLRAGLAPLHAAEGAGPAA